MITVVPCNTAQILRFVLLYISRFPTFFLSIYLKYATLNATLDYILLKQITCSSFTLSRGQSDGSTQHTARISCDDKAYRADMQS